MSPIKPLIHLLIPQFLQPLSLWKKDFLFEPKASQLSQLLSQFDYVDKSSLQGLDANLFKLLGMAEDSELPVATYRSQIHATFKTKDNKALICADPIHLEVGMNDITMTEIIDNLTQDEAEELINDLNMHFKQDALEFIVGSNCHWYLALPSKEVIETIPLDEVLRKNIAGFLPSSEERNWRVIQNESQMILHASSVNQQREIAGLSTVNSLWFWGGGYANKCYENEHDIAKIYYNNSNNIEIKAKMIANIVRCDYQKLREDASQFSNFSKGKTLIILDQLFHAAVHDNLELYQQKLTKLDEQIIKPLREAWLAGEIDLLIDSCDGNLMKPLKPSKWKFWTSKSMPLSEIAAR